VAAASNGTLTGGAVPPRLIINVADLRRRLGQRREEPIELLLPSEQVIDTRNTVDPVVGTVVVESIERGVSVYGSVRFRWEGDCRRCLEPTGGEREIDIDEIFQVDAPEDSELIDFDGDHIDLVPIVREAVVLSLPLAPLCREDCAGPDPDRYPATTADAHDAAQQAQAAQPDPRWAALDELDLDS
jgi:uncharacterized protein